MRARTDDGAHAIVSVTVAERRIGFRRDIAGQASNDFGVPRAGSNSLSDQVWTDSVAAYRRTRQQAKQFVLEVEDLTARVPTGKESQTQLRSILLIIDHAAYHVGQIVALRRALGIWPTA